MKLATLATGGDGTLLVVSKSLKQAVPARAAPTLQAALGDWDHIAPQMQAQYDALNNGEAKDTITIDPAELAAILPRSYQFLDASAFLAHNHILAEAWGFPPRGADEPPLMYQGLSNLYYPSRGKIPFRSTGDDIDLEAEFGVITDAVPMGVSPDEAITHAKLIILINDWSLRAFGPNEMRGGFGFLHAKPPSALSAFAMTPDELGSAWRDGRVCLPMTVYRNGQLFGNPNGSAMHFGFGELIAHAALTRNLCPATVIGSGTVSNFDAATVGSACIAERRALDMIAKRKVTPYLGFGDRVQMTLLDDDGQAMLGTLDHEVVAA